jgi:hypothetical protein
LGGGGVVNIKVVESLEELATSTFGAAGEYCSTDIVAGCKWSLRQLRRYFHQTKISDWLLWQRVSALVVLTAVSQLSGIPSTANCFEFYGFDVLIDASLRPWLLEVRIIMYILI